MKKNTSEYPSIFRPLTIGGTSVRHRIMITGHTQLYGANGTITERHIDYYRERAIGGAALLILEQQAAHPAGRNYHAGCEAWDPKAIPWYEKLGKAVHEHGCKQFVQLFACGAQGSGTQYFDDWRPLWAASQIPSAVTEEMPIAMEQPHINELVEHFVQSAVNVQKSGLDGVEIHAAHSQLLGEFLSPAFNKRTDGYGGSIENRCRIVLEVGKAIRDAVGDSFALGLRISFDEFLGPAGITPEQSEKQLQIFSKSGLFDFFDLSAGGYHTLHIAVAPMGTMKEAFLAESAKRARAAIGKNIPLFIVGRFLDLAKAEEVLKEGEVDMVAMTRAHMADAHIISKSTSGATSDVTHCIGANVCISRLVENREVTCFQNPSMGRESYWGRGTLKRAEELKKISVVGGGPAGLRFAGTAAARGHSITIYESCGTMGGRMNMLKVLPTRGSWQRAIDNLLTRAEKNGVSLETSTSFENQAVEADIIILATGSNWTTTGYSPYRPERLSIPGHELDLVLDIDSAIKKAVENPHSLGKRVVIVDETGEYLPLGLAEILATANVHVEIVSPRPFVGADTLRTLDMPYVLPRLKKLAVKLTPSHFVEEILPHSLSVYDIWGGEKEVRDEIDTVVFAMTKLPNETSHGKILSSGTPCQKVGDVIAPRKIEAIYYDAEKLGRSV